MKSGSQFRSFRMAPTTHLRSLSTRAVLLALPALAGCGSLSPALPGPPETFSHRVERDDLPAAARWVLDAGDCHVRVVHGVARVARLEARTHDLPAAAATAALAELRIDSTVDPSAPDALLLSAACPSADPTQRIQGQWTLVLPEGDSLSIHTTSGTVDVQALDCRLSIETEDGPVRADVVAGDLSIRTDSGRVRVSGPFGRVAIDSAHGPVDVTVPDPDLTAADLSIHTDSARVALHAAPEDLAELTFLSKRGSVQGNLGLPGRFDPETGAMHDEPTRLRVVTESGDLFLWRLVESRATSMARAGRR